MTLPPLPPFSTGNHSSLTSEATIPYKTTPFPNELLDEVMPHLKDTEWRILCVIVRQTLGWRETQREGNTKGRKTKDWLTQSQLKRRTGRASEAISQAIDTLIKAGLIEVLSEGSQLLITPGERKRHTRLYFRLAPPCRNHKHY